MKYLTITGACLLSWAVLAFGALWAIGVLGEWEGKR